MSAIDIRGLVAGYPGQKPVLKDLNLAVSPGEMVALCGANGSGKSTLLKVLSGHLHPLAGSVEVLGVSPLACRGRVAYLPQKTTFDPGFPISVREMVTLGLVARLGSAGGLHATAKAKILEAMQQLEISEIADKPLSRLSGGQLQRAVLARCLAQSPEVMLLDEPLSAADGRAREIAWEVLTEKARQGVTLLIATHTELDLKFCHRCLTFSEGSALETNQTISTTFHGVSP